MVFVLFISTKKLHENQRIIWCFFNFGPFYLNYEGFEQITESKNGLERGPNP